ncbi:Uncharacterized protein conserved in archaea [Geoglobus ahangari]|uniref:Uncharacterized protein conserved in archaea n=1 Tax=Geoglobus ahangari TaxID=113653 RepID=A0A0F7IFD9_9EURY|nr:DUF531 family protein [Geoglobus ahangari]AKG91828.1 Uncharacterized protein conserved in archaea [Geoglobus ahangari]
MMVACLVNTYDKLKLHEIHLRTIARAAPLCYAYDFHLALLDFNFWESREEMVEEVAGYTTIGEGGRYLRMLDEMNRLHLIDRIPSHFGEIIATTSKPEKKPLTMDELRRMRSACFLIGLGRKGLPKDLIKKARHNLDITFKGVSLETCSAMGAIMSLVWVVRYGGRQNMP